MIGNPSYLSKWQTAGDDFLSVVLAVPTAYIQAVDLGVSVQDLPAGPWRSAYRAAIDIRTKRLNSHGPNAIMDSELAAACGPEVTVTQAATWAALFDSLRTAHFAETCALLTKFAAGHRQLETLRHGTLMLENAMNNGMATDKPVDTVIADLQLERQGQLPGDPVDVGDLVDRSRQSAESDPVPGLPTGIHLVDGWIGGMATGELVALVGAYKSRKSSLTRCVVLSIARQKKQVDVYSFDESRVRYLNALRAQLMAEYMFNNHYWDTCDEFGHALNIIDGKTIHREGKRWHLWAKPLQLAYTYALDTLADMRGFLRIYDSKVCGGSTFSRTASHCRINAMRYGGLDLVVWDHLQRFSEWQKTYDQVEIGSPSCKTLVEELGAVGWLLSQQNEEAIKGADEGGYSPNAKGGGGLASSADTILITKYKQGAVKDNDKLRIELRLAREADAPVYGYVEVHPASGWITPRTVEIKSVNVQERVNDYLDRTGGTRVPRPGNHGDE